MPLANSPDRYGSVAKIFHWLTAVLILLLLLLGLLAANWPERTGTELQVKVTLFSLHKTLGVLTFALALLRILWALSQPRPAPLHPGRPAEHWAAETVHWLLYGSLVLVPLTGWAHHAATTGLATILWPFGQSLPLVPKDDGIAALFSALHLTFVAVLAGAIAAHVAGALKHRLFDRDATLSRMWFGEQELPPSYPRERPRSAFATALLVWIAAVAIGVSAGVPSRTGIAAAPPAPVPALPGWRVETGTLAITVSQFGKDIRGQFSDWTADITFDPAVATGPAGTVDVTIAIDSLSLGSATSQAMGPDFFNVLDHPTATFAAAIEPITDGHVARGTLTIRDRAVPVALPFGLSLRGDTASMTGQVALDRRDFGIGANLTDASTLDFAVTVDIDLIAIRTPD